MSSERFEKMVIESNSQSHVTNLSSQQVHMDKINESLINNFPSSREGPTLF